MMRFLPLLPSKYTASYVYPYGSWRYKLAFLALKIECRIWIPLQSKVYWYIHDLRYALRAWRTK